MPSNESDNQKPDDEKPDDQNRVRSKSAPNAGVSCPQKSAGVLFHNPPSHPQKPKSDDLRSKANPTKIFELSVKSSKPIAEPIPASKKRAIDIDQETGLPKAFVLWLQQKYKESEQEWQWMKRLEDKQKKSLVLEKGDDKLEINWEVEPSEKEGSSNQYLVYFKGDMNNVIDCANEFQKAVGHDNPLEYELKVADKQQAEEFIKKMYETHGKMAESITTLKIGETIDNDALSDILKQVIPNYAPARKPNSSGAGGRR